MRPFNEAYTNMIRYIESAYRVDLSLGEKVSLRLILKDIQTLEEGLTLDDSLSGDVTREAVYRWVAQYTTEDQTNFEPEELERFRANFRMIRDRMFML